MAQKVYSFKEATKSKIYKGYGLKEAVKTGIYKGTPDETGFQALEESGEINVIRKYLLRDTIRNHHVSMSKAKLIVETIVKVYETLLAQTVSNGVLAQAIRSVTKFDVKMQTNISKRGGENEEEIIEPDVKKPLFSFAGK